MLDFELAYENFLEQKAYDHASNELFTLARNAFTAGYEAGGGKLPFEQTKENAIQPNPEDILSINKDSEHVKKLMALPLVIDIANAVAQLLTKDNELLSIKESNAF